MVMHARAGVSLIEAVIALTLLAAGLLTVASTGARSAAMLRRAAAMQGATLAAVSVLDSLTQLERPASGATNLDRYQLTWQVVTTTGSKRIALVVRYADGGVLRADTFAGVATRWPARLQHVP